MLPALRHESVADAKPPQAAPAVREQKIPGKTGDPDVHVYVIGDQPGASKPLLLHMHGGGYVAGSPLANLTTLQKISSEHDCVVVTVDYRLAPETPFPGALEDNYAALRWAHNASKSLGIDTNRIAIKGESAGGGHAAALAFAVRERKEFKICQQILIYPMLDDRTGSTRRVPPYIGQIIWTEQKNRFGWSSLLGVPAGSSHVPQGSVPGRIIDLSNLPPTFIGFGSIDLFCC